MDITKELKKRNVVMMLVPSSKAGRTEIELVKALVKNRVCYITTTKTYQSLLEEFRKRKVDTKNIMFIDTISKSIMKINNKGQNCYYVDSPGALTELSLVIAKFLKHGFDYLVFDAINNLLVYRNRGTIEKFISNIVNIAKDNNTKTILIAIDTKEHQGFIKQCSLFVDHAMKMK